MTVKERRPACPPRYSQRPGAPAILPAIPAYTARGQPRRAPEDRGINSAFVENVDLLPANIELSAMEMMLVTAMSRETILRSYLSKVKDNYDYVLIDCMPSLGMVTLNALAAADSVIIPVQAQYLPAKGMTQLMQTIGKVRQYINPSLRIDGILLNIVDNRTNLAKSTADALRKNFGSVIKIYRSSIPMAVKAAEVASKGVSIYKYEPSSPVAKAYAEFAKEVSADGRKKERLHSADAR